MLVNRNKSQLFHTGYSSLSIEDPTSEANIDCKFNVDLLRFFLRVFGYRFFGGRKGVDRHAGMESDSGRFFFAFAFCVVCDINQISYLQQINMSERPV